MNTNDYKFDGIILDIDGTIWNTTSIVAQAWNEAVEEYCGTPGNITAEQLQKEFGKTMDAIAQDLWPQLSKEQQSELIEKCCEKEHIAVESNEKDITFSTVIETVKDLAKKIPCYIVSNCQDGYIELTMKKTGLTPYIKDIECYGHTLKGKSENISFIINRNNIENPVYIGDTLGDADACKKAGVPFIWASYGFGQVDEYYAKLDVFSDIYKYL